MAEAIQFPDVEAALVTYLTAALAARGDTASVHVRIPKQRPARFVLVPRLGGTKANLVADEPTIGFECWANTDLQASNLARLTRALVHALRGQTTAGVTFYRVTEFAGPANLPDPTSNQSRYVFTVAVQVRGSAL